MPLIQLLEVLIVVGVLLWLVNRFIPMQGTIKSILEWCRSHCRRSVDAECFWAVSFTSEYPHWDLGLICEAISQAEALNSHR